MITDACTCGSHGEVSHTDTCPWILAQRVDANMAVGFSDDGCTAKFIPADGGGNRFDAGKSRVDLLPADALMELGKVYEYGALKYSSRNWERGMPWSKVIGPLMRHLFKWMMGQKADEESGQRHIAMVAWNALALLTYELRGIGTDDRKGETK